MAQNQVRIKLQQPIEFDTLYEMVMADPAFQQSPPQVVGKNKRRQLHFNGVGKYNNAVQAAGNKVFVTAVVKPEQMGKEMGMNMLLGAGIRSLADTDIKQNEQYLLGLADHIRRITGGQ